MYFYGINIEKPRKTIAILCNVCLRAQARVGADAHIGPAECTSETRNLSANSMLPLRADVGIGPYKAVFRRGRIKKQTANLVRSLERRKRH